MGRLIPALVLMVVLSGCSSMAGMLLPSLGKGINADAELTVGKKEESLEVETQIGSRMSEEINAEEVVVNNQNLPMHYLLLFGLLAGWAIPDPQTCGRGVLSFLRALLPWARSDN